ncbi:universal stress protein [Labrenzia sp. 011]|uniref:universal stress protein n=1 Tax=Labrenzia sp. 011 TaxID=2171494 RepID=UPI000D51D24E|nr:universal stress protein [Labrenzia sp. 011]PVB62782.1 universal stress protein [Labrenzia sp. 011]
MKKIMVATDFSERSDRALRRAILLARQFAATIALVHVIDDDQPLRITETERGEAETLLRQTAATLRDVDAVECHTRVVLASPFAGIVQAVAEIAPDLLVIGPHRRHVLRDVFVGTTAERTIRSVHCPVLMVNAPPAGTYRHILQTTDLSEGSADSLKRFAALGIGAHARTSVLHVFDAPALRLEKIDRMSGDERESYLSERRADAARRLAAFLSAAGIESGNTILHREESTLAHEIVSVAEKEEADLVVLATHGRSKLSQLFIGSITEQVLRSSSIDVLAIPPLARTD